MNERFLAFFADPMCSWCYGFGPELDGLLEKMPGLRVDVVMGGLRPYSTQKVSREFLEMVESHWRHVHEETGLQFNDAALHREGFVYDTEPACRAVVTARSVDPALAMPMLKAIHRAFYHHGRDVTSTEVLADLASAEGMDRTRFVTSFLSTAMREDTRADFSSAKQMGVTGFPTLAVAHPSGRLILVVSGYARADVLVERLARIAGAAPRESVRRAEGDD